jgi:hypothetical protein
MIHDEDELRTSIDWMARMYKTADGIASSNVGDPATRADEIVGVDAARLKIEREVAEYLARKYGLLREEAEIAA